VEVKQNPVYMRVLCHPLFNFKKKTWLLVQAIFMFCILIAYLYKNKVHKIKGKPIMPHALGDYHPR
jgi:hypothetical protein